MSRVGAIAKKAHAKAVRKAARYDRPAPLRTFDDHIAEVRAHHADVSAQRARLFIAWGLIALGLGVLGGVLWS